MGVVECYKECFGCLIAGTILTLLFLIPIFGINNSSWEMPDEPYVTHDIMALQDSTMMSGRIYMRSGYINEDHTYLYGYKTSMGGMKTQKVRAEIATVYFTDDVEPHAEWFELTRSFWYHNNTKYQCDIYIPTGSLVEGYAIDLQ